MPTRALATSIELSMMIIEQRSVPFLITTSLVYCAGNQAIQGHLLVRRSLPCSGQLELMIWHEVQMCIWGPSLGQSFCDRTLDVDCTRPPETSPRRDPVRVRRARCS